MVFQMEEFTHTLRVEIIVYIKLLRLYLLGEIKKMKRQEGIRKS
jgi:hypothetical protein